MIGFAFPDSACSGCAGGVRCVVQASFRLLPFEPLIWLNELYRFDWMFPFSRIQFAPACADNCAGEKSGIAAVDFDLLPNAPTANSSASEKTDPKINKRISRFNRTSS